MTAKFQKKMGVSYEQLKHILTFDLWVSLNITREIEESIGGRGGCKAVRAGIGFQHPKKTLQQAEISSDGPAVLHCPGAEMSELGWNTGYQTLTRHSQQKAVPFSPLWGHI